MGNKQPKLDPKEEAKQNKRTIQRAVRQIDRERTKLQAQEAKTLREIKNLAMKNQHVRFGLCVLFFLVGSCKEK